MSDCRVCLRELCLVHCIYCDVDVNVDDHTAECPSTTGVFPVDEDLLAKGAGCPICDTEFQPGDFYASVPEPSIPEGETPIVLVVCLGCSLIRRDEAWSP